MVQDRVVELNDFTNQEIITISNSEIEQKYQVALAEAIVDNAPVERDSLGNLVIASESEVAAFVALKKSERVRGINCYNPTVSVATPIVAALLVYRQGQIARVATDLNATYAAVKRYIDVRPALQEIVETFYEENVEKAEDAINAKIQAGDVSAAKFLLSTKGAARGYVQKLATDGAQFNVVINTSVYDGEQDAKSNKY